MSKWAIFHPHIEREKNHDNILFKKETINPLLRQQSIYQKKPNVSATGKANGSANKS